MLYETQVETNANSTTLTKTIARVVAGVFVASGLLAATLSSPSLAQAQEKPVGCVRAGCSNELCVSPDQANAVTPCSFRDSFVCYNSASCEVQTNGQCGWTQTPELLACIAAAEGSPTPSPVLYSPIPTPPVPTPPAPTPTPPLPSVNPSPTPPPITPYYTCEDAPETDFTTTSIDPIRAYYELRPPQAFTASNIGLTALTNQVVYPTFIGGETVTVGTTATFYQFFNGGFISMSPPLSVQTEIDLTNSIGASDGSVTFGLTDTDGDKAGIRITSGANGGQARIGIQPVSGGQQVAPSVSLPLTGDYLRLQIIYTGSAVEGYVDTNGTKQSLGTLPFSGLTTPYAFFEMSSPTKPTKTTFTGFSTYCPDEYNDETAIIIFPSDVANPFDFNRDGVVDITDYSILLSEFFMTGPNLVADVNNDNVVDLTDYSLFLPNFSLL